MASTTTAAAPTAVSAGRRSGRSVNTLPLVAPSVVVLFLWMIVPLAMTLWFSFQYYNLLDPTTTGFAGFENYTYLLTDPSLWTAMLNTLYLVFWVLAITVGLAPCWRSCSIRNSTAAAWRACSRSRRSSSPRSAR